MNRSPIHRTLEKLSEWQRTRRALRKMSQKRVDSIPDRATVRAAVFERDGYRCQIGGFAGPCFGPLTVHHLKKASANGKYTEDNLIAACAACNSAVEDHPKEARERGLIK